MGRPRDEELLMVAANPTPSIATRLTAAFGLRHPFACAGLAFAGTTPPLAIAVARAGAIGAIGVGKLPAPAMTQIVGAVQAATDGVLNVNFITIFTSDEHIDACVELRPAIASFHWGHPKKAWIDKLQAAGIKVWEQIGSVEMARVAADDGVDAVIVQGAESGGHNFATLPLFALLPAVIDAVQPLMVLAAGAIVDGRGAAAALAMGADGVWVGTRMAATQEGDIADAYKQRILAARGEDAVLSSIFGNDTPEFNPMRVLNNDIVAEYAGRDDEAPRDPSTQPIIGAMSIAGMPFDLHRFSNFVPMKGATGDVDQMPLLVGQGVGLINDLPPAAEVIERMMTDAGARLRNLGQAAL